MFIGDENTGKTTLHEFIITDKIPPQENGKSVTSATNKHFFKPVPEKLRQMGD